ncbi:MAG: hypothetical protein V4611_04895 [Patescibacteria group bacterium]
MDLERPGKLIKGNRDYFMKIATILHDSDSSFKVLTLSEVTELVNQQLDPLSAEIVTRRLIGQLVSDIAVQMNIDEWSVSETLKVAPQNLHYEELEAQRYAVKTMARLLGKTQDWATPRVKDYGQYKAPKISGRIKYHQEVFESLEAQANEYPPAEGWMTDNAMALRLNKDIDWVRSRLTVYAELVETRLTIEGRAAPHYPPEVFETLEALANEYPPAGDWMTEDAMAIALDRSFMWVRMRIEPYFEISDMRLQKINNRPRRHYPPQVYAELQVMSEKFRKNSKKNGEAA